MKWEKYFVQRDHDEQIVFVLNNPFLRLFAVHIQQAYRQENISVLHVIEIIMNQAVLILWPLENEYLFRFFSYRGNLLPSLMVRKEQSREDELNIDAIINAWH